MNLEAGGLPIEGDLPDGTVPVAALTAIKVMYPDGQMAYLVRASDGLSLVEALGMSRHAQLVLEEALMTPGGSGFQA